MPSRLNSPVITVDMAHISKVDPSNVDNLFSMWTIFSKCAESLENGRRLENLSWRLWNRETFCCDDETQTLKKVSATSTTTIKKPQRQNSDTYSDIPELSSSVESAPSEDELPKDSSDRVGIETSQPCIIRGASVDRYRGKEKHMTPVHLAKIMEDIDRNKSSSDNWMVQRTYQPRKVSSMPNERVPEVASMSPRNSTSEPESSLRSTHSVIRGFSPGRIVSSYRSSPSISAVAKTTIANGVSVITIPSKKTKPVFFLGSSSSSLSDDDLEETYTSRRSNPSSKRYVNLQKSSVDKKTSFRDEVTERTVYDDDISTDDEIISESAIEEEDCSDWESSTDSLHSSYDEGVMFKRVESRPELTSRRSLLSTMLHEPERAAALETAASRSSPVVKSRHVSPRSHTLMPTTKQDGLQQAAGITRSKPIIMTTSNTHPPALSPRTTRRNMLASELTESLRKHLLWERQQKNTTASAHMKRRHTAHDVTKLTEYPTKANAGKGHASKNSSWNNYFDQGHNGYHAAGW